jgi:hypothetical protein
MARDWCGDEERGRGDECRLACVRRVKRWWWWWRRKRKKKKREVVRREGDQARGGGMKMEMEVDMDMEIFIFSSTSRIRRDFLLPSKSDTTIFFL